MSFEVFAVSEVEGTILNAILTKAKAETIQMDLQLNY